MIIGINETVYNIARDQPLRRGRMVKDYNKGIRGMRSGATQMLDPVRNPFFTQTQYEQHKKNCIADWLSFPGTEWMECIINNNYGVENCVPVDVWRAFLIAEGQDDLKARCALIACGLRVRHGGILSFLKTEILRYLSLFTNQRVVFEVANPDVYLWYTDWKDPLTIDAKGVNLCRQLSTTAILADPRAVIREIWNQAIPWYSWARYLRTWIFDSSFAYVDGSNLMIQPRASGKCFCEIGSDCGELVAAARAVDALNPSRAYFYCKSSPGGSYLGWESKWDELYALPDAYALVTREGELAVAIEALAT